MKEAPAFIMGVASVVLGTPKRFIMHIRHKRKAFKPSKLYAHICQPKAFILEKVVWGWRAKEQIMCPIDLNEFGLTQQGLELALPPLEYYEGIAMTVFYTGQSIPGLLDENPFSLPIIWAESGANLRHSEDVTLHYSVE